MVLKPGKEAMAAAIFEKWELDFAVIGEVTDTSHMVLEWNGEVVCDIPLGPLAADAPEYERPYLSKEEYKAWAQIKPMTDVPDTANVGADLLALMATPNLASKRWIYEQYDSQVGADTMQTGGDAAVVRVPSRESSEPSRSGTLLAGDPSTRGGLLDPPPSKRPDVRPTIRSPCRPCHPCRRQVSLRPRGSDPAARPPSPRS